MPAEKALAGLRVLLTRPAGQEKTLASLLREHGARVLHAPLIRTVPPKSWRPLDAALRRLDAYDLFVFTSANGVDFFFRRARALLGRPPRLGGPVYAVGPATARALRERGVENLRVPERHEGGALADAVRGKRGKRVLLARAAKAREELPRRLRRAGARVTTVPAYRTLADRRGLRTVRALARGGGGGGAGRGGGGADWVTFTSSSTALAFAKAASVRGMRRFFEKARAASIGPITSGTLRGLGVEPAAEGRGYDARGLAEAVASRCRPPEPGKVERTLRRALLEAGSLLKAKLGKVSFRYKGPANLLTQADLASEQKILDILLGAFPDHDYLAEERTARRSGSDFLWVIDPLDGTTNYAHGFPVFCVSIALLRRGRPWLGGVYDPCRGELFLARRGHGATLNGRPLRVSGTRSLSESLLLTGFSYDRAEKADYYVGFYRAFMERCHDVRRSGSAALDLAWTAAGRVDGYWEFKLSPWDVAAGMLLVEEAGGRVGEFNGGPFGDPRTFGRQTLATNGRVHEAMLRVMRPLLKADAHGRPMRHP